MLIYSVESAFEPDGSFFDSAESTFHSAESRFHSPESFFDSAGSKDDSAESFFEPTESKVNPPESSFDSGELIVNLLWRLHQSGGKKQFEGRRKSGFIERKRRIVQKGG